MMACIHLGMASSPVIPFFPQQKSNPIQGFFIRPEHKTKHNSAINMATNSNASKSLKKARKDNENSEEAWSLPSSCAIATKMRGIVPQEICAVCGAAGAGRHYGSVCCCGCKGFFRRSVRFQKLYTCPYEKNCAINKLYRNCCRACRFQKCLQIGLDPNLVHGDWGQTCIKQRTPSPNGSPACSSSSSAATATDSLPNSMVSSSGIFSDLSPSKSMSMSSPSSSSSSSSPSSNNNNNNWHPVKGEGMALALLHHNQTLNSEQAEPLGFGRRRLHFRQSPVLPMDERPALVLSQYFVAVERFCDLFVDCPSNCSIPASAHPKDWLPNYNLEIPVEMALREPRRISPRFPITWEANHQMCTPMLARVYCRLMVHYFDWASHVPELREFSDEDKQTLIVKRAMRCIWLLCAFRSALFNAPGIMASCGMLFPYGDLEQAKMEPEFRELFRDSVNMAFTQMVQPFRQMQVTEAEYALLRVLCLFTPVSRLSEQGRQRVLTLQAKYLNALGDLVRNGETTMEMGTDSEAEGGGDEGGGKGQKWSGKTTASSSSSSSSSAMLRMSRLLMFLTTNEQVAQMDDNAYSMLNVFNFGGMRGTLTYDMHVRAREEMGMSSSRANADMPPMGQMHNPPPFPH